jgi:hypothetical protein
MIKLQAALLVSPPFALAIDIFAGSRTEIGRADDEDLEALRAREGSSGAGARQPERSGKSWARRHAFASKDRKTPFTGPFQ